MPTSIVIRNSRKEGSTTVKNAPTFTGDVYLDMIHADDNIAMANVTFTPCARSYWHTHEKGQVLRVTMGSGWICDKGGKPQRIDTGDLIYAPPGTTHWHGAGKGCAMTHLAIGIGETKWLGEVTDEEYKEIDA